MDPVVVIGAGGHAKVIVEILQEAGEFEIVGCLSLAGGELLGVPILGDDSLLPQLYKQGVRHGFIALGENRSRQKKAAEICRIGFTLANAISSKAVVSRRALFGCGVAVMPGAVINVMSRVEDGAIVNTGANVDHDCRLGPFSHIGPGVNLAGGVSVGEGAFLGTGVSVIPRISVGDWTVVGAGAVVIGDLPEKVTAVGVPAGIIKRLGRESR
jgi:UDP-perosamine 4-acetyltransferase